MAKNKITPGLQEAILLLSQTEKNKLLIRLINKDELLMEQLQYKLLENSESDLVFRRSEIREQISIVFSRYSMPYFKDLLYYIKSAVSLINRHFKITKDKKGELELLVYVYLKSFEVISHIKLNWKDQIFKEKMREYSITKIKKMETLLNDIHEDYKVEFEDDINTIQHKITQL